MAAEDVTAAAQTFSRGRGAVGYIITAPDTRLECMVHLVRRERGALITFIVEIRTLARRRALQQRTTPTKY